MVGLFSLPNEILIKVLESSPNFQTAVCLSSVNKLLRDIQLENDRIAQRLIRATLTIPAVEEAIDLAIIESRMHIRAQNAGAMAMAMTRESNLAP